MIVYSRPEEQWVRNRRALFSFIVFLYASVSISFPVPTVTYTKNDFSGRKDRIGRHGIDKTINIAHRLSDHICGTNSNANVSPQCFCSISFHALVTNCMQLQLNLSSYTTASPSSFLFYRANQNKAYKKDRKALNDIGVDLRLKWDGVQCFLLFSTSCTYITAFTKVGKDSCYSSCISKTSHYSGIILDMHETTEKAASSARSALSGSPEHVVAFQPVYALIQCASMSLDLMCQDDDRGPYRIYLSSLNTFWNWLHTNGDFASCNLSSSVWKVQK